MGSSISSSTLNSIIGLFLGFFRSIMNSFSSLFSAIFGSFGGSISTMFSVFSSSLGPYKVFAPIVFVASLGGAVVVGFGVFMIIGPEKDMTEAEDDL